MAGEEFPCGDVLIENGKIAAVGEKLLAPADAEVIDAGGRLVTPGLVEAHCHVGLENSAVRWEGMDINEKSDPIQPQLRAIDGIYPQDEMFRNAREGGVTCVITGPGSSNVLGGTFAAVKTAGKRVDDMIVKNPVAMKCAFGENPKFAYGQNAKKAPMTRMTTAALLRETLFKAKEYLAAKESGKEPAFNMKLEALIPVLKKEIPLKAHAHRADDIFTAVRIAKEFDLRLTLDHVTDGALIAEDLAKEGYPCFVGPSFGRKSKVELLNKSFTTPAALHAAGCDVCIITDAGVTPIEALPLCAGLAVEGGLPKEAAWLAITKNPALYNSIGDRVGTLEKGKDADLVIWQADPLSAVGAKPDYTFIDGKIVYQG